MRKALLFLPTPSILPAGPEGSVREDGAGTASGNRRQESGGGARGAGGGGCLRSALQYFESQGCTALGEPAECDLGKTAGWTTGDGRVSNTTCQGLEAWLSG